jgi:serine protease Do
VSRIISFALIAAVCSSLPAQQQSREEKVRADKKKVEAEGFWIYNDLPKAFEEAKRTGKPLLVVLRCIPCEECVKLDDDLVDNDPIVRPLLDKFVCVRQVSTNGLDLGLFQFDTDQSFAAFLLNADGTIYGRFGTRSHRTEWVGDVSLLGLAKALQGALDLHTAYPADKAALQGKRGPTPAVASPELYPSLKERYTSSLNYSGNVVQSCIHCHQIGDAQRDLYRTEGKPMPEQVLYPYPHPAVVGLTLDPRDTALVKEVAPDSAAHRAGIKAGDLIEKLNGQPLLSIADVQWVLHHTDPQGGKLPAVVRRDGKSQSLTLALEPGWRRAGDISWRASTWGLRRMSTGGLMLEALPVEGRAERKIPDGSMAILVKNVGQYGAHAAAKNAGFQKEDIIVEFDGRTDLLTADSVLIHGVTERKAGDKVKVVVLRNGERKTLQLPMQK